MKKEEMIKILEDLIKNKITVQEAQNIILRKGTNSCGVCGQKRDSMYLYRGNIICENCYESKLTHY